MAMEKIGSWAFIIGLIIAVAVGLFATAGTTIIWVLAFLGLIVGLLNVTSGESQLFLVAAIAFMVSASGLAIVMPFLRDVLQNIVVFTAPAAAIVALRALYEISEKR
ncbi:MAG: hypothetical protein Q7R56_00610 [Nanoarchaeota archaeon]|nr:hypothetical protein [Nanoarchaeota archaeon]